MKPTLKVLRSDPTAILPCYSTAAAACFDIHACETKILYPQDIALIQTGLIFNIPEGYSLRLHPRSGLALKHGITLLNAEGVVDEDYILPVGVILINNGNSSYTVYKGDRICQGELVLDVRCVIEETQEQPQQKTNRTGGFGSTGQ